jgi:hypothetical protein
MSRGIYLLVDCRVYRLRLIVKQRADMRRNCTTSVLTHKFVLCQTIAFGENNHYMPVTLDDSQHILDNRSTPTLALAAIMNATAVTLG